MKREKAASSDIYKLSEVEACLKTNVQYLKVVLDATLRG